jgi:hypothetical protein
MRQSPYKHPRTIKTIIKAQSLIKNKIPREEKPTKYNNKTTNESSTQNKK